jgi:hypothetical protein
MKSCCKNDVGKNNVIRRRRGKLFKILCYEREQHALTANIVRRKSYYSEYPPLME